MSRIAELGAAENFWAMGETGPCGRCSEIHYHRGDHLPCAAERCLGIDCDCDRYVEIWNNVFMEFERRADGALTPLPAPSIDTGMGLERIVAVLQEKLSNYDTDLFTPLLAAIGERAGTQYGPLAGRPSNATSDVSLRVIADHLRAMTFLIADGVVPSNEWRGYVLRKIMRRAMRHGKKLGLTEPFLHELTGVVIAEMAGRVSRSWMPAARSIVVGGAPRGERSSTVCCATGLPHLEGRARRRGRACRESWTEDAAFRLYDTFGIPRDFIEDMAQSRSVNVDREGFERAMEAQRTRARAGAAFGSDQPSEVTLAAGPYVLTATATRSSARSGSTVTRPPRHAAASPTCSAATGRRTGSRCRGSRGRLASRGWRGGWGRSRRQRRTRARRRRPWRTGSRGARTRRVPEAQVPFSSARRWSAVQLAAGPERRTFVLGAPEALISVGQADELLSAYESASARGLRGVAFAEVTGLPDPEAPLVGVRPLALITIGDVLRPEVKEAFRLMEQLDIEPKIISGDNPQTVAALLQQLRIVTPGGAIAGTGPGQALGGRRSRRRWRRTASSGASHRSRRAASWRPCGSRGASWRWWATGANDVHALRAADIAVAMESGTSTARGVAGIVLVRDSFSALIRGAQEATFVLGNSARLSKLFMAKSVYAYLLIFATSLLGLDFPFLPRHGSLTATLALGIPAVFISISIPPPKAGKDFLTNVLRFALPLRPSGISLAIVAMVSLVIVQVFVEWAFNQGCGGHTVAHAGVAGDRSHHFTSIGFMIEVLRLRGRRRSAA